MTRFVCVLALLALGCQGQDDNRPQSTIITQQGYDGKEPSADKELSADSSRLAEEQPLDPYSQQQSKTIMRFVEGSGLSQPDCRSSRALYAQ